MLGRCSAEDSDADSLMIAESEASALKRVRTINKKAGLKIIECRTRVLEKMPLQASFSASQARAGP